MRKQMGLAVAILLLAMVGLLSMPSTSAAQWRYGRSYYHPSVYQAPYYGRYNYYGYQPYRSFYRPYAYYGYPYYGNPYYGYPWAVYPAYVGPRYYGSIYLAPNYYPWFPPTSIPAPSASYAPDSSTSGSSEAKSQVAIDVRVPMPDAEVWFDGTRAEQMGVMRSFTSPPLAAGKYTYRVRAQWIEDGVPHEQTRTIEVQPGQHVTVDFTSLAREKLPQPQASGK